MHQEISGGNARLPPDVVHAANTRIGGRRSSEIRALGKPLARVHPARTLGAELPDGASFVLRAIFRGQYISPATVHSFVDERACAAFPRCAAERSTLLRVLLHPIEGAVFKNRGPARLINLDIEEGGHAPHLTGHVLLQLVIVNEENVGQIADRPPGSHILPERPEGKSVAVEPVAPILANVGGWRIDRGPDSSRRVVQQFIPFRIGVGMVVVEAPQNIASIARDVYVFRFWRKYEGIDRQMGLKESAGGSAPREREA